RHDREWARDLRGLPELWRQGAAGRSRRGSGHGPSRRLAGRRLAVALDIHVAVHGYGGRLRPLPGRERPLAADVLSPAGRTRRLADGAALLLSPAEAAAT